MTPKAQIPWITPAEQISQTMRTLQDTLALKGWPNARRQDLQAIVAVLEGQWQAYQAGTLRAFDPSVEV